MTSVLLAPRADHGHVVRVLTDRVATLQRSIDRLGAAFADGAGTMARLLEHLNFFDGLEPRIAALEEAERRRAVPQPSNTE